MIPECFILPYIGINGGCDDSSSSGLYINDLDAMTFSLFSAIAKDENVKGETEIRRQEKQAIIEVINDFKLLIQKEIKLSDIKNEYSLTGNYGNSEPVDRIGFQIDKCYEEDSLIEVLNFSFYTDSKKKVTVNVDIDGILTQFEYITKANAVNTVPLNISVAAQTIKVYVNLCGAQSKEIVNCTCDCTCNCRCADIKPLHEVNGTFKNDKSFIRTRVICRNNWDNLICNYANQLSLAVLYKLAIKVLRTVMFTDNYSQIIENKQASLKEALNIYEGVPGEGQTFDISSEYWKALYPVGISARMYLSKLKEKKVESNGLTIVTSCLN